MVPDEEKKEKFLKMRVTEEMKARVREVMAKSKYKGHEQDFLIYALEKGIAEVEWEQAVIMEAREARSHYAPKSGGAAELKGKTEAAG